MSENLPKGWMQTSIGKLTEFNSLFSDGDWVESKDQDVKGKNRLIQLADIGDGVFIDKSARFMNDEQFSRLNCTNLKKDDILIARMPEPLGRACLFPLDKGNFATVVDVAILRTPNADHYWLMTIINSQAFRKQIELNAVGTTRTRIPRKELSKIKLIAPPLSQQQKIARILSTVDAVIEKTEAAIAKYKAIKVGMMHDLFTRGIADNGQLRPAYEDAPECYKQTALGWIPKEWKIARLEEVTDYVDYRGKTPPKSRHGIFLVTARNIKNGFIDYETSKEYIPEYAFETAMSRGKALIGDVVITTEAPMGNIAQIDREGIALAQRVIKYSGKADKLLNDYLAVNLMSNSFQRFLISESTGSTVLGIKGSRLHKICICLPTIEEQRAVSKIIKEHDALVRAEEINLQKYQKLKQGLMQDLLTGEVAVSV